MKLDPDAETRIAELARRTFPRGLRVLLRPFVRASLRQAVLDYKEEVQRAARDKARARKELERAVKLADQLSAQVSDLSQDTRHFINRRTYWGTLDRTGFVFGRPDQKPSLDQIKKDLSRAKDTLALSLRGLHQKGRPSDDVLDGLLFYAFWVWTQLLRRPFSLDWTSKGEPLTDAAAWCEQVCRTADPEIAPQRVRTAALKARERMRETNNLRNPLGIVKAYFKRSGWLD
jgi:hypothetical protein